MRVQDFIGGLLVFALFMLIIGLFVSTTYSLSGFEIDSNSSATLAKFEQVASKTQSDTFIVSDQMSREGVGGSNMSQRSDLSYSDNLVMAGWRTITSIPSLFSALFTVFAEFSAALGIHPMIFFTIATIIIVGMLMLLISGVLQNRV